MQWTVEQIISELGHLDVQILSYMERASMKPCVEPEKLKALRKWFKNTSVLLAILLAEMHANYPALHAEIVNEQAAEGLSDLNPNQWPFEAFKPTNMN